MGQEKDGSGQGDTPHSSSSLSNDRTHSSGSMTASRRSLRLPVEIPVRFCGQGENGQTLQGQGKTLFVSAHGAHLAVKGCVRVGQSLILTNAKTGKELECVVRSTMQSGDGMNHVGIEFAIASPEFWDIIFPSEGGNPAERKVLPLPPLGNVDSRDLGRRRAARGPLSTKLAAKAPTLDSRRSLVLDEETSKPRPKDGRAYKWPMLALGLAVALVTLWTAMHHKSERRISGADAVSTLSGLPAEVARVIPDGTGYRLADAGDFDSEATRWLQSLGQQVSGEISGRYAGPSESQAYLLVGKDKPWRVIILVDGELRCDAHYQAVVMAVRVPKELIPRVFWNDPPAPEPDGDGLLIVRSASNPASGVVLFLRGIQVVSGTPANYRDIPLLQTR